MPCVLRSIALLMAQSIQCCHISSWHEA